jgi:hypothetical protein
MRLVFYISFTTEVILLGKLGGNEVWRKRDSTLWELLKTTNIFLLTTENTEFTVRYL